MKQQKKHLICDDYINIFVRNSLVLVLHYNNTVYNHITIRDIKNNLRESIHNGLPQIHKLPTVNIKIVKNTLIKHSIQNTRYSKMIPLFAGPTLLVYLNEYSNTISNYIIDWCSQQNYMCLLGGKYNNSLISSSDLLELVQYSTNTNQIYLEHNNTIEEPTNQLISILEYQNIQLHTNIEVYNQQQE